MVGAHSHTKSIRLNAAMAVKDIEKVASVSKIISEHVAFTKRHSGLRAGSKLADI